MNDHGAIERLEALVHEQARELEMLRQRLGALETGQPPIVTARSLSHHHSRRDLLRTAGVAAAGAAGAAMLRGLPAQAASGANLVIGNTATSVNVTNSSADPTYWSGTGTPNYMFWVDGQSNTATTANTNGVVGYGAGNGSGLTGNSVAGVGGFFVSSTGLDALLGGSGRLGQVQQVAGGTGAPAYAPATNQLEIVRGDDGSVWASRATAGAAPAPSTPQVNWKRLNTLRVDSATGSGGLFTPVRIVDTSTATGGPQGPLVPGTPYTFGPFANGVPSDAVALLVNLTALNFSQGGTLTVFPAGTAAPAVSTLAYGGYVHTVTNFAVVALGTGTTNGGKFTIQCATGPVNVQIDLFGYLQ